MNSLLYYGRGAVQTTGVDELTRAVFLGGRDKFPDLDVEFSPFTVLVKSADLKAAITFLKSIEGVMSTEVKK